MDEQISDEGLPVRRSIRLKDIIMRGRLAILSPFVEHIMNRFLRYKNCTRFSKKCGWRFPHVQLDAFVIMPDHLHGILHFHVTDKTTQSLGRVIGAYKSLTTVTWFDYAKTHTMSWSGSLWQRNYHEHILRDAEELAQKRRYIRENPQRWAAHPNRYT